ncbi:MAG: aminodeoxychorismate synthase component I [Syntrophales bacterium]|nr:aminodeoxychorismate synthase component I [Syntrophales bacterium]
MIHDKKLGEFGEIAVVYHAEKGQWMCFKEPHLVISAMDVEEVIPNFEMVEQLTTREGLYAVGFISYEAANAFDDSLVVSDKKRDFPLLWFGLYRSCEAIELPPPDFEAFSLEGPWPSINKSEYEEAIARIKNYLESGDTYQVNFTFHLKYSFHGDPWHLFLAMLRSQNSYYAAWIDTKRFSICSASPELFFCLNGSDIICKPMKGTIRRGRTIVEDQNMGERLRCSEKNRAENIMIVDMVRNDLSRVAEIGSVKACSLFDLERHPTLWQMTSTVKAVSRKSLVDIMRALFPCASITGAPKVRTCEIIRELEQSPRGLYTGCIGFITPNRYAQFNVAIRTAVLDRVTGQLEYGVGGGIVWDSDWKDEYEETLLKARILTEKRPDFSLLETLLWTPDESYFLLDYHLRRLKDSADYFGFPVDVEEVRNRLLNIVPSFGCSPKRIRLTVTSSGHISIEVNQIEELYAGVPVRIGLAKRPINSNDVFLYHKTTYRIVYEMALKEAPDYDDVLLWNEKGELTESCFANVVLKIEGKLYTPPVEAGLLGGTFRAWLIENKKIGERRLTIDDAFRCSRIYLINSVRKWREAKLCH